MLGSEDEAHEVTVEPVLQQVFAGDVPQQFKEGLGKEAFKEVGNGTLDFPAILKYLDDSRFRGWIVVEQSRSNVSPQESARFNAAYLTRLGYDLS